MTLSLLTKVVNNTDQLDKWHQPSIHLLKEVLKETTILQNLIYFSKIAPQSRTIWLEHVEHASQLTISYLDLPEVLYFLLTVPLLPRSEH